MLTIPISDEILEAIADRVAAILIDRQPATAPVRPDSAFVTIPEAAEILRCSRQRVDDLLSQRRLTRVKEGSRTLIRRDEIERHLREGVHGAR